MMNGMADEWTIVPYGIYRYDGRLAYENSYNITCWADIIQSFVDMLPLVKSNIHYLGYSGFVLGDYKVG